jgi:hypothetical protein
MFAERVAAVSAAAFLTAAVLPSPAHAAPGYLCLTATAVQAGGAYSLSSTGCSGSGSYDVPVLVWSGEAAGSYVCRRVTYAPLEAEFDATGCVRS